MLLEWQKTIVMCFTGVHYAYEYSSAAPTLVPCTYEGARSKLLEQLLVCSYLLRVSGSHLVVHAMLPVRWTDSRSCTALAIDIG